MKAPLNAYEATVLALSLALTAQTVEQVDECVGIAASLGLTKEEMDRAKIEAVEASISFLSNNMWSEENDQS